MRVEAEQGDEVAIARRLELKVLDAPEGVVRTIDQRDVIGGRCEAVVAYPTR